jgi:hypothetical protein
MQQRFLHSNSSRFYALDFTLAVVEHLWDSSISVQRSQWQADIKASKLYLIAWPVGVIDPTRGGAAIDLDSLVPCGDKDIFLNMGTGAIIAEFLPAVVSFGRS